MEKKETSEKGISRRDFVKYVALGVSSLSMPSSVYSWGLSRAVVNEVPLDARERAPGYLKEHLREFDVYLVRENDSAYLVSDKRDKIKGGNIRPYIKNAKLLKTSVEFEELENTYGIDLSSLVLDYQIHGLNGFVKGHDDYLLAFVSELQIPSSGTKGNLEKKLEVVPKSVLDEFSVEMDRSSGRKPIPVDERLNKGFGYEVNFVSSGVAGPDGNVSGGDVSGGAGNGGVAG